jgi:hypothetical protein
MITVESVKALAMAGVGSQAIRAVAAVLARTRRTLVNLLLAGRALKAANTLAVEADEQVGA